MMPIHVSVGEARARFSELLKRAHDGGEVVLVKDGRPYARIVAVAERRKAGAFRGQIAGDVLGSIGHDFGVEGSSICWGKLRASGRADVDLNRPRRRQR